MSNNWENGLRIPSIIPIFNSKQQKSTSLLDPSNFQTMRYYDENFHELFNQNVPDN